MDVLYKKRQTVAELYRYNYRSWCGGTCVVYCAKRAEAKQKGDTVEGEWKTLRIARSNGCSARRHTITIIMNDTGWPPQDVRNAGPCRPCDWGHRGVSGVFDRLPVCDSESLRAQGKLRRQPSTRVVPMRLRAWFLLLVCLSGAARG